MIGRDEKWKEHVRTGDVSPAAKSKVGVRLFWTYGGWQAVTPTMP